MCFLQVFWNRFLLLQTAFRQFGLAAVALLCVSQPATAQNFNQVVGFGDSTLDTGWYTGASSGPHSTGIPATDAPGD